MSTGDDPAQVVIVPYDATWGSTFAGVAAELGGIDGFTAREILHIGSTAVPGLAAKPIIDIALLVDDSADELSYRDALGARGFRLVVREPEWFEHRMLRRDAPAVNLHVYSVGCEEVDRVVRFRDWLRANDDDRELYGATKQQLAQQEWADVQDYARAKDAVVAAILARADAAASAS